MKLSLRLLLLAAFSTRSRIFDTVDSANALVVRTLSSPFRFTQPERISSPLFILRGTLSPVSATVSRLDVPSITTPSMGTFSPGRITIISPTFTISGATLNISPSRSTFAVSGRISIRCDMDLRLRPSATSSNISPIWKKSITNTASGNCVSAPGMNPMASAPIVAMLIRKSSLMGSPSNRASAASLSVSHPTIR